jgi:hypothetical protein
MQGATLSTSYKKMKTAHFIFSLLLFIVNSIFAQVKDAPVLLFDNGQNKLPVKKIEAVSYQQVIISDQFWKPKIDRKPINRYQVSIEGICLGDRKNEGLDAFYGERLII